MFDQRLRAIHRRRRVQLWLLIPHDAVGDRSREAHDASLHDLQAKNGEVVSTADVVAYLQGLKAGDDASNMRGGE